MSKFEMNQTDGHQATFGARASSFGGLDYDPSPLRHFERLMDAREIAVHEIDRY